MIVKHEREGTPLRLIPKTRKGKNKIHEAGTDQWLVIRRENSVICFWGQPGILIEPDVQGGSLKSRWVRRDDDSDFTLEWA